MLFYIKPDFYTLRHINPAIARYSPHAGFPLHKLVEDPPLTDVGLAQRDAQQDGGVDIRD